MTGAPPLIRLIEGRKPRARKAPTIQPKEITLHMPVAKLLREHCLPDWQWCHVPNGELRDIRTAVKLKHMGVKKGWPDFWLAAPTGKLHCLELKRIGEGLTEDQEQFQLLCIRHGTPYVVAHSIDEVLVALDAWQCLRIKLTGQP